MKHAFGAAALISMAALLGACGGGGGGGTAGTPSTPAATAVAITESNAKPVAASGMAAATNTSSTQGTALVTGVQVDTGAVTATPTVVQLTSAALALARQGDGAALATGVSVNQTVACTYGGTATVSGNVSNANGLSAGDSLRFSASNCREVVNGVTSTLNGAMSFTVNSGSFLGTVPAHLVMTMTMDHFAVQTPSGTVSADGDVRVDMTLTSATQSSLVASGTSLSTQTTTPSTSSTITLRNYSQTVTVSSTTVTSSISATVETQNARLGSGTITYTITTPTPFTWNASTLAIGSGSVKVVGANNAQLIATFASNGAVTIQLDANGDGTFEKTVSATVTELQGLL